MADKKAVRTRRRVIATIIALEVALLLFHWLVPGNPDKVGTEMRYDFLPLDMLIVVLLVLFAAWALGLPDSDDRSDITTFRGYAKLCLVLMLFIGWAGLLIGTVVGGWLLALEVTAVFGGCVALMLLVLGLAPLLTTPRGKRAMARVDRVFVAVGHSAPVRRAASYFAAEDVV